MGDSSRHLLIFETFEVAKKLKISKQVSTDLISDFSNFFEK